MRPTICLVLLMTIFPLSSWAVDVTIDPSSARAVLQAVQNPGLTLDESLHIAAMKGNKGLIRKENSYGRAATEKDFAEALVSVAHGKTPSPAFRFNFQNVKANATQLETLINSIEQDPAAFSDAVRNRVNQFSPQVNNLKITGYLIVGGVSGGFAFGEPEFFLNLAYFPEFHLAQTVMEHELYHAVQNEDRGHRQPWYRQTEALKGSHKSMALQCASTEDLFDALYQEGSAELVGDPLLLSANGIPQQRAIREEIVNGLQEIDDRVTLLELSITGLEAPQPVPYDRIYALGFYRPEPLYVLGYVMAKAIDTDHGAAALIELLHQPGYSFAENYIELPKYAKDAAHPKLGQNTVAAIQRLIAGCPAGSTQISE